MPHQEYKKPVIIFGGGRQSYRPVERPAIGSTPTPTGDGEGPSFRLVSFRLVSLAATSSAISTREESRSTLDVMRERYLRAGT